MFSKTSRLALELTELSVQCVPGVLTPRVKQLMCEADHSPQPNAKV
jgi:hypothetical protein